jgi:hypothetical protein
MTRPQARQTDRDAREAPRLGGAFAAWSDGGRRGALGRASVQVFAGEAATTGTTATLDQLKRGT